VDELIAFGTKHLSPPEVPAFDRFRSELPRLTNRETFTSDCCETVLADEKAELLK